MKIGIDARMIEHSGIGTRIRFLLEKLPEFNKTHQFYLFGNEEVLNRYSFIKHYNVVSYNVPIYNAREFLGHPYMSEMDALDIPHFNAPINYINKCIVTIHDITPYRMKEFFGSPLKRMYLNLIFRILKYSRKVVTVSNFTANDLVDAFGFSKTKMIKIYNGIDHKIFKPVSAEQVKSFKNKYGLPENYFLTIGIGKGHKNVDFLLRSLSRLWISDPQFPSLVIGGTGGRIPGYLERTILDLNINKYIIAFPKIEYEELPFLYAGAKLFLFPSLYEGFGFPPVEAQSSGCPVFSSNASALPEILGDSVAYFNPKDEIKFALEITELIKNPDKLKKLSELGIINSGKYSWENAARETIGLYNFIELK